MLDLSTRFLILLGTYFKSFKLDDQISARMMKREKAKFAKLLAQGSDEASNHSFQNYRLSIQEFNRSSLIAARSPSISFCSNLFQNLEKIKEKINLFIIGPLREKNNKFAYAEVKEGATV